MVDYIAPLLYPSHWAAGAYGVADPNAEPGPITRESLKDFQSQMQGSGARLVPWFQDFSLGVDYGPKQVCAQIDTAKKLLDERVEVAFLALHGRYGEDGSVQGLLESMFIPYTGSGVLASAVGMEKVFSKEVFLARGIPTPPYQAFPDAASALAAEIPFGFPRVVKPSREGSSVGVHICHDAGEYRAALKDADKYAGQVMVEAYVKGREVQGGSDVLGPRSGTAGLHVDVEEALLHHEAQPLV